MGQGIRALCKKDWAVRVVSGGEEVYSSSAKDFPNSLNRERVERPFLWRKIVSAPWFILPGTCKPFSERRVASRPGRPGDLAMTPQTCCLSVLAHGVPECPAGRIYRPDTLLAFLGSWCADPTPLRTTGRRSVCPRTAALPNPCWKHLSWQPSFCAPCLGSRLALARRGPSNRPGLIHRPESPLCGGGCKSLTRSGLEERFLWLLFFSRFFTFAWKTQAFSLCTVVASTPRKHSGLQANWSV